MWNQRYSNKEYVYGKKPNDFLLENVDSFSPGKVLCLAEEEGWNATYLASLGHKVLAVFDIKSEEWDTIISILCHLPGDIRYQLHQKVVRGLKPGGTFLLEAYTPLQLKYNTGGPKDPDLLYDLKSLTKELCGLIFTHAVETVRDIYEDLLHVEEGSVVQIIATKPERR